MLSSLGGAQEVWTVAVLQRSNRFRRCGDWKQGRNCEVQAVESAFIVPRCSSSFRSQPSCSRRNVVSMSRDMHVWRRDPGSSHPMTREYLVNADIIMRTVNPLIRLIASPGRQPYR